MKPYSVLVVDDSAFMRKLISDFIGEDSNFQVIDTARNGIEAIEKVERLQPDAITMDVEMPEMNGLEALRHIMKQRPTPVIMLSSLTEEGADITIQALESGAFDFVGKPSGSISLDLYKVKRLLLDKLRASVSSRHVPVAEPPPPVMQVMTERITVPLLQSVITPEREKPDTTKASESFRHLIAIGTSTGGPRALHRVISELPGDLPAPVLIVQHMPPNFTRSLAQRLDSVSQLHVVEAEDGMNVRSGTGYIAPGGWHMTVIQAATGGLRIKLTKDEPRGGHRPSVDTLFESLIGLRRYSRHIVLMTGMGSDGAKGMAGLREAGAVTTIAEAEETCVVYGMPRAAVEAKAAMHVLPQQSIAEKLVQSIRNKAT